ncbi:hypothetical protein GCK72_004696 [Caenorhabditis remanei]|uniref:Sdz-33 F-box domain-containing protein n=1 Tax=Caenorhabditis remanei TaxID=31234 RepID=A0A6A5HD36_CAERE|nr:hypothetical protein GCK72_004696 [Caenorhabditis remanei]KAF1764746.1 hypothetical protein GCK72_004696 [Caenorhabditis remanei]
MCIWKTGKVSPTCRCTICRFLSKLFNLKFTPFPLLKLPLVPLRLITRMMNSNEILKLSICSYQMELFLKSSKYKVRGFHYQLNDSFLQFDMGKRDYLSVNFEKVKNERQLEKVTKMKQLCNRGYQEDQNIFSIEYISKNEILAMCNLVSSLYSSPFIQWAFHFDDMEMPTFWYYFDKALTGKCDMLVFREGSLSEELLTAVMDRAPVSMEMCIFSDISLNFRHSKAMKYFSINYKEARWVTVDDLKTVRNSKVVTLETTNFDSSDINEFLKYWVDLLRPETHPDIYELLKLLEKKKDLEIELSRIEEAAENLGETEARNKIVREISSGLVLLRRQLMENNEKEYIFAM